LNLNGHARISESRFPCAGVWHSTAGAIPIESAAEDYARRPLGQIAGMTLIELLIVVAIIMVLASIAVPSYMESVEAARIAVAIGDIEALEKDILAYEITNDSLPIALEELGRDPADLVDPWGNPYQYLNFFGAYRPKKGGGNKGGGNKGGKGSEIPPGIKGKMRKDRNLVPINTRFDLYSMGRDGASRAPLTAAASQDDIVRANDGSYIGLAANY